MSTCDDLDQRLRALHDARFKEFEEEVVQEQATYDRAAKFETAREKRRREFLGISGIDLKALDRELEQDQKLQEKDLADFLDEFKPKAMTRRGNQAGDARDASLRMEALGGHGQLVLPPYAATIYTADRAAIKDTVGVTGSGAINSGWVFPDDPGRIRLKDTGRANVACFQAVASPKPPEFAAHFGFVPAATGSYEMTAVVGFHGFYVLRSDDSWYNCRHAKVKLSVEMNVHQYVDMGWKSFPAPIDHRETNAELVRTYDRGLFFDYTAVLKAGDPVVVTLRGVVDAFARGGGAYAEINFEAGTANYIEPFFLSVARL